ncbi:MAG: S41 family peptidase [Planctomycetes bacterium]|nr:S41 family peptidase [Planctomycetota bacterium]
MTSIRRLSLILFVAAFSFFTLATSSSAFAQSTSPQAPRWQRDRDLQQKYQYLREVSQMLQRYHLRGEGVDEKVLVKGARETLGRAAKDARYFETWPEWAKSTLASAMDNNEYETISNFFDSLSAFVQFVYPEADATELADLAASGLVSALNDPYSRVLTQEEFQEFMQMMQDMGDDRSIGASFSRNPENRDQIIVSHVRWGGIGYNIGLRHGDVIESMNGLDLLEVPRAELRAMLEMEPGTEFTLRVRREGYDEAFDIKLAQVQNPGDAAYGVMLPGNVGYIRTTQFVQTLDAEIDAHIRTLKAEGMKSLILDLRNNPGGAMNTCMNIASFFLTRGQTITSVHNRMPSFVQPADQTHVADGRNNRGDFPLVTLINEYSASASEMLSGALKGNNRSTIIGTNSYGKGIGQTFRPLQSRSDRYLYFTVLEYFDPAGEQVHEIGISPDVVVADYREQDGEFGILSRLWSEKAFENYVNENWTANAEAFEKAARPDTPINTSEFPGFRNFLRASNARGLSDATIAHELRRAIFAKYEEVHGEKKIADIVYDPALKRGWEFLTTGESAPAPEELHPATQPESQPEPESADEGDF